MMILTLTLSLPPRFSSRRPHFTLPESLVLPPPRRLRPPPTTATATPIEPLVRMSASCPDLAPVLLGYNGDDLWFVVGLVMVGWLPHLLLPRWQHTPRIPLFPVLVHAVVYTFGIVAAMTASTGKADFNSFEGVHQMLSDPNVTLPAWLHYCLADLLIGRWIYLDAMQKDPSMMCYFCLA
jgi:hypothetical protein